MHSHVDGQPFKRSGGIVAIQPESELIIRLHMSSEGYSNRALKETISSGFSSTILPDNFAHNLESTEPLLKNVASKPVVSSN